MTAFWWNVPIGIFGGIFYMAFRFSRGIAKTEAKEAIASSRQKPAPQQATIDTPASKPQSGFTGLLFGTSCGELYSRGHVGGVPTGEAIYAAKEDACKNTIVFGGIGSGKTTRVINPLLAAFEQQCGALIFDIKADFSREV